MKSFRKDESLGTSESPHNPLAPSPQKFWTLFLGVRSAATSASALSFRTYTFSSSRMRFCSGVSVLRERLGGMSFSNAPALARFTHSEICVEYSPSRRINMPSSSSVSCAASLTTRRFPAAFQVPCFRLVESLLIPPRPLCSIQRYRVGGLTPTSLDRVWMGIPFGPFIQSIMRAL